MYKIVCKVCTSGSKSFFLLLYLFLYLSDEKKIYLFYRVAEQFCFCQATKYVRISKNMKGMRRECESSYTHTHISRDVVFGTFRNSGYDVRSSVENHRKRFVAGKSRRVFYRDAWRRREFGPEWERRNRAAKGDV